MLLPRTSDLVQRLQAARRDLRLPAELAELDRFDLLIGDDFSYVRRDLGETSVLFEFIAKRYERKSLAITANHPFSEWGHVFAEPAMTLATVARLVHHATIFEMNVESFRRRVAQGASPFRATQPQHLKAERLNPLPRVQRPGNPVRPAADPSCGRACRSPPAASLPSCCRNRTNPSRSCSDRADMGMAPQRCKSSTLWHNQSPAWPGGRIANGSACRRRVRIRSALSRLTSSGALAYHAASRNF